MTSDHRKALISVMTIASVAGSAFAAPPAFAATTATLVAAPSGSGESCTELAPCSLTTAKAQACTASDAGDAVNVLLRGGTYVLSETLEFTADDSGSADAPVTFKAFGTGHQSVRPALAGARLLRLLGG